MTFATYKQMNKTEEGRKILRTIMMNDVKQRMNKIVAATPVANQSKCQQSMDMAFAEIEKTENYYIFMFFSDEHVSTQNFLLNCKDVINGNL